MRIRSRSRDRSRGGGGGFDSALTSLLSYGATDVWDFVSDQYVRGGLVGPAGLSITRASSGYAERADGTLVEFGSGVLRRTDRGVLVEGARTNLLIRSQEFDSASWTKSSGGTGTSPVVTANDAIAPDGTLTAELVVFDRGVGNTSSDRSRLRQDSITTVASTVYISSVFFKAATPADVGKQIAIRHVAGISYGVITLTANWQRYTRVETAAGTNSVLEIESRGGQTADNAVSAHIWGAQLEAAPFASSYIKTEGSTVTRAAEVVTAVPSAGTDYPLSLFAEFVRNGDTGGAEHLFQMDAGSNAESAVIRVNSSDLANFRQIVNNVEVANVTVSGAITVGVVEKIAGRSEVDSVVVARNGNLSSVDTSAAAPLTPQHVRFGITATSANPGFAYLRRCAIIPSALTNAQLQAITT